MLTYEWWLKQMSSGNCENVEFELESIDEQLKNEIEDFEEQKREIILEFWPICGDGQPLDFYQFTVV